MIEAMLERIIYKWVADNFGESEADDPSWDIKSLAQEIARHKHEIYHEQEFEYVKEDVEYVANEIMGVKLTDKELYAIADKYMNSESYAEADIESIEYYIEMEKKQEK